MVYIIDANVFIQAKNTYYGMDFCPAFWDWILKRNSDGIVASTSDISTELQEGKDRLSQWSTQLDYNFFLEPDEDVYLASKRIVDWVQVQSYKTRAIDEFLDGADHMIVSHALVRQASVVTHEKSSNSRKKVKIPDVCIAFGVECILPYEMLRREKARFVLGNSS